MPQDRRYKPLSFRLPAIAGAIMTGSILALVLFVLPDENNEETLEIGDRTYEIPDSHLSSLTRKPHVFVRIKQPGRPFELVYDSRLAGHTDSAGVPQIFSINDQPNAVLRYERNKRTMVVCRRASAPVAGCGTWIRRGSATWSILFAGKYARDGDSFAADAIVQLRAYERDRSSRHRTRRAE